ncbi:hypothetical protein [Mycolicibacterium vanbaalenii]|uniref:hypothetical protein n=1 Tax=Mycolicibacterium vanbaalenii TaxID=110539 RepID=UPI001F1C2BA8|nr:hypothetical protein [Mycolicibacterium vanbaalenii]
MSVLTSLVRVVRVFRAEDLSDASESADELDSDELGDELEDELEDEDEVEPEDESSVSACAVGMASAAPTPRNTARAPTRPMNFPEPASPLDLQVSPSAAKIGERITPPEGVSWITSAYQV